MRTRTSRTSSSLPTQWPLVRPQLESWFRTYLVVEESENQLGPHYRADQFRRAGVPCQIHIARYGALFAVGANSICAKGESS